MQTGAELETVHVVGDKKQPSLILTLGRAFGSLFFTAAIFKVGQDLLTFVSPQVLK